MKSVLPPGWAWATVDDLARYVNGLAFKPSDWKSSGRPIIRIQNLTGKTAFNHTTRSVPQDVVVREGDILVSWSATLDVFVWRGPESVLNQHIFKVIPASHVRDHVFLRWALKNAIEELWASEHSHGTTMKHVNRGPFLAHTVKLPPAAEQRRIADALESYFTRLDDAVATLERVQRNLKRYRASVLKAAVEGRLVPTEAELARAEGRSYEPASVLLERILAERRRWWEDAELAKMAAKGKAPKDDEWKAKYVEPVAPDTSGLPELPEGWCWASVDALAAVKGGITKGQKPRTDEVYREVPYLRVANVQRGFLDLQHIKTIQAPEAVIDELRLEPGDVLFNEGGDRDKLGRGWIWRGEITECIHQNHVFRARMYTDDMHPELLSWYGNTAGQKYFFDEGKHTTNLASINLTKLRALPVPVPPRAEQTRIRAAVERQVSVVDDALRWISVEIARCARLRQSILKWAFEGRLVDQDPTDEPASVLLERIRGEREAARSQPARRVRRIQCKEAGS